MNGRRPLVNWFQIMLFFFQSGKLIIRELIKQESLLEQKVKINSFI